MISKIIILTSLVLNINAQAEEKFIVMYHAKDIENKSNNLPKNTIIFFDIDDTLITPISSSFRTKNSEINLIDEIKNNKNAYSNYNEILSNWRLTRKTMLVDPTWPEVINRLKQKHQVFGLTKMDVGKFGNIKSMEEWRYNELKAFGIEFSSFATSKHKFVYHGIFMTGPNNKSEIIKLYLPSLKPSHIMFIDDKLEYLEDVSSFCTANNIPFTGILYRGADNLPGVVNTKVKTIQKHNLITNNTWLEDEEIF